MLLLMDFYIVGMLVAFFLGYMLAMYYRKTEEEQQFGLVAFLALMSWVSVCILLFKFKNIYKIQFKWFKRKCHIWWWKLLNWFKSCLCA